MQKTWNGTTYNIVCPKLFDKFISNCLLDRIIGLRVFSYFVFTCISIQSYVINLVLIDMPWT